MARWLLAFALLGTIVACVISSSTHVSYACDPNPCPRPGPGGIQ
jgi:hypothetical protein